MIVGRFYIKKEDELYLITHRESVLAIEHSLERANMVALQLMTAYDIGYKLGFVDAKEESKYHYM